jgi:hypothetical protein
MIWRRRPNDGMHAWQLIRLRQKVVRNLEAI